ncbi:M20/M25/M40 family metallo-hydrolase [Arthrobacter sp. KFRI-F3372]|uniref:M20/M25/M40 family metallo-hydrolase n=1 Tax=Pseudarthrobacter oxydans TaxID=1671 RepID=UPI0027A8035D|nr:M20/M25/M40 family metallo-hydrolase [Actinomycetes bacterium ARC8]WHP59813.1 M20/M25/M40 family metallo-hydrolase [Arthrobacter sp. KFRI-F3372]
MFTEDDKLWLLELLRAPSVSPLEGGSTTDLQAAQQIVIDGAVARGFRLKALHRPDASLALDPILPAPVRERIAQEGVGFLTEQPSAVLAIGRTDDPKRTIVLNFHVDTVGPHIVPELRGDVVHARGAVDDKGPGVAAIVGVAAAFRADPGLLDEVGVIVTAVPGEESGAFGVYGTRDVLARGDVRGSLMVFLEPTGGRVIDAASGVMTPEFVVSGRDSTDDLPTLGTNATLILAHAATTLTEALSPVAEEIGAKLCVAGIHTGDAHNRVYGTGKLKLNIAYFTQEQRTRMEEAVEAAVANLADRFETDLGYFPEARAASAAYGEVMRLDWQKRGLPALANRHPHLEKILADSGFERADGPAHEVAFTCDAVWAQDHANYVVVLGPGELGANGAHTDDEHVTLTELGWFAGRIRSLVEQFAADYAASVDGG